MNDDVSVWEETLLDLRAVCEEPIRRDGMCLLRPSKVLRLLNERDRAEAERDRYREALEQIASGRGFASRGTTAVGIARAALD